MKSMVILLSIFLGVVFLFIGFITYCSCFYENLTNKKNDNVNENENVNENAKDTKFFQNDFNDVQFHDSVEMIESKNTDGSWVIKEGKVIYVPWSKIPTTFTYSSNAKPNYIPSYMESIFFSKEQMVKKNTFLDDKLILF